MSSNLREQLGIFLPHTGVNRLKGGRGGKGRVEKRPDKLEWWQTQQITLKTISSLPLIFSYSAQSASGFSIQRSWNEPLWVINAHAGRNLTNTGKTTDDILSGKRMLVVFEISPNALSGEETDEQCVCEENLNVSIKRRNTDLKNMCPEVTCIWCSECFMVFSYFLE